jgi:hypothetical protein
MIPYRRTAVGWYPGCSFLPVHRLKTWEMETEVIFARTKGRVLFVRGQQFGFFGQSGIPPSDLNMDLGLPDHNVIPSMSIKYNFRPRWSIRYSLMPIHIEHSGHVNQQFGAFGGFGGFGGFGFGGFGQGVKINWERMYHRAGLVYVPIRTFRAKVSIFGEYVRLDERISVIQVGCCGSNFDNVLNMGMAGMELERSLRTASFCDTLSLQCRMGIAFLDEACGGDLSTQLKYSIPMGNGRWGYLAGGYRFVQFKKGYSDFKYIDTSIEGGFLKMGLVF